MHRSTEIHRLVLIAKSARVLRELHAQLRVNQVDKVYWACTAGKCPPIKKRFSASRKGACAVRGANGEGVPQWKRSRTDFKVIERFQQASLLEVKPISGAYSSNPCACSACWSPDIG